MEAKDRARFVPKWGPAPPRSLGPPLDPILEVFRVDFWRLLASLGTLLGHIFGKFFVKPSCDVSHVRFKI